MGPKGMVDDQTDHIRTVNMQKNGAKQLKLPLKSRQEKDLGQSNPNDPKPSPKAITSPIKSNSHTSVTPKVKNAEKCPSTTANRIHKDKVQDRCTAHPEGNPEKVSEEQRVRVPAKSNTERKPINGKGPSPLEEKGVSRSTIGPDRKPLKDALKQNKSYDETREPRKVSDGPKESQHGVGKLTQGSNSNYHASNNEGNVKRFVERMSTSPGANLKPNVQKNAVSRKPGNERIVAKKSDIGPSVHPRTVTNLPRDFKVQVGSCHGEPDKLQHSNFWIILKPYKVKLPPNPFPHEFSIPNSPGYFSLHTKASSLSILSTEDKATLAKHINSQGVVAVKINDTGPVNVKPGTAFALSLYIQATSRSDFADWIAADSSCMLHELLDLDQKGWKSDITNPLLVPHIIAAVTIRTCSTEADVVNDPDGAYQETIDLVGACLRHQLEKLPSKDGRNINDDTIWRIAAPLVNQTAKYTGQRCEFLLRLSNIGDAEATTALGVAMSIIPAAVRVQSAQIYLDKMRTQKWTEYIVKLAADSGIRIAAAIFSHGLTEVTGILNQVTKLFATGFAHFVVPVRSPGSFQADFGKTLANFKIKTHNIKTSSVSDTLRRETVEGFVWGLELCWNSVEKREVIQIVEFSILKQKIDDAEPGLGNLIRKGLEKGKEKLKELSQEFIE